MKNLIKKSNFESKFYTGSWQGKKAITRTIHKNSNEMGLRIHVMHWIDSAITEIRVIFGDGRTPEFEQFEEVVLTPVEAEHEEAVIECLTQKWFK